MALGTQIASLYAKIGADTRELNKGLRDANARLDQTGKKMGGMGKATEGAEGSTKNFGATLAQFATKVGIVTGLLGGMAVATKKAFEFSEQGAAILQTAASFDRLGVSIEEMRAASRGTIDDVGLMSSTLTLVAGASEDLQAKMLVSAPQLMEIAKAANAVNPALGDTSFMYDSLARGIKRSSPLILDNLGIIVKVGEANETYAAAIGKTVEELTAEDKQIALLNATMEAGSRLIEQAGESTEAYGDAWGAVRAHIKNATDAMKENAAEGLLPIVQYLADYLDAARKINELDFDEGYTETAKWENLASAQAEAAGEMEANAQAIARGNEAIAQGWSDVGASAPSASAGVSANAVAWEQYNAAIAASDTANLAAQNRLMWETSEAAGAAAIANMNFAASIGELSTAQFAQAAIDIMAEQMRDAGKGAEEIAAGTRAILIEFGLLTPAEEEARIAMDTFAGRMAEDGADVDMLAAAILNVHNYMQMLEDKEVDLTVNTHFNTYGEPAAAGGAGGYIDPGTGSGYSVPWSAPAGGSGQVAPQPDEMLASGGQFWTSGPAVISVGEGAEPEFVSVIPKSDMQAGGYGAGSTWSGNLIVQGAGSPEATADLVLRKLADRGMIAQGGPR